MPCYSVVKTAVTDRAKLIAALIGKGYTVTSTGPDVIVGVREGTRLQFVKSGQTYNASGDKESISAVLREYATVGIRAWARKYGFAVAQNDGRHITLTSRRTL